MSVNFHHPKNLPVDLQYGEFAKELATAQYHIGLLQGSQSKIQNAMHLIGPLVAKEAAVSSKIEGTQSTSSDVYIFDAGGKPTHSDTPVVSNYRTAMLDAIMRLREDHNIKITSHLIKSLHGTLLKDVRHKGVIGDFRNAPVWIGERDGDPIEKAIYVPPEHVHVPTYIDNMLQYIDSDNGDVNLVKAGVIHYQFEAVHPFDDGNGRIGRLLIPLILFYKGDLSLPIVYSSGYFEARPQEYRRALRTVDNSGKYEEWLRFFLNAITAQSKETLDLINKIQSLHDLIKEKHQDSKSPYLSRVIDFLFDSPVFTVSRVQKHLSVQRLTADRLVKQLLNDRTVTEIPDSKGEGGSKLYAFLDLLVIIR